METPLYFSTYSQLLENYTTESHYVNFLNTKNFHCPSRDTIGVQEASETKRTTTSRKF